MSEVSYTVAATFPDAATAEAWLNWLRFVHVAEVMAGGATAAEVVRVDGEAQHYEIRYRFPSREAFALYEKDHAPRLRAEGARLFPPERVAYRRVIGDVVAEF